MANGSRRRPLHRLASRFARSAASSSRSESLRRGERLVRLARSRRSRIALPPTNHIKVESREKKSSNLRVTRKIYSSSKEEFVAPLGDRSLALALLLELALQRATLRHVLNAVLILLELAQTDKSTDEIVAVPLVPFLRRLGRVEVNTTKYDIKPSPVNSTNEEDVKYIYK